MKNTIRASHHNSRKTASVQIKKDSVQGQNDATIGHERSGTKGKVTVGAIKIGDAVGLPENEIKALSLIADWEGEETADYCRKVIRFAMQTSVEKAQKEMKQAEAERSRFDATNLLGALPSIFHISPTAVKNQERDLNRDSLFAALTKLEIAKFEAVAFIELLSSRFEATGDGGDPFVSGVGLLTPQICQKIIDAFDSVFNAYKTAFPAVS